MLLDPAKMSCELPKAADVLSQSPNIQLRRTARLIRTECAGWQTEGTDFIKRLAKQSYGGLEKVSNRPAVSDSSSTDSDNLPGSRSTVPQDAPTNGYHFTQKCIIDHEIDNYLSSSTKPIWKTCMQ